MSPFGELMETLEETKSEAKISRKSQTGDLVRPVHKYSIENDINKLFDTIDIKNAYKALVQSENNLSDGFCKSAMKRPMRVGSNHASSIGISESASLKQALRRLCISHASEMAATKMQLSKSTPFTGISKAGSTRSLYRAVVFDADEAGLQLISKDKANLVEVSLVPETNASASSIGILPSLRNELKGSNVNYTAPSTDAITQKPGATETLAKDIVGRDCLYARSKLKKKLKLCNESVGISSRTKLPALDENVCHSVDVPFSSVEAKAQEGRSTISNSTFVDGESSSTFKAADNNPHFVRHVFRRKNIVNKRPGSDLTSPSGRSSRCNSGVNTNSRDGHCGGSCWSHGSSLTKGYNENEVSPEPSSSSVSDVNKRNYGRKINDRSRWRDQNRKTSLSSKSSIGDNRSSVSSSDESIISGSSCRGYRTHMSKDLRWKAINCVEQKQGSLSWKHFKLLRKLGGGDIGNIYLSELVGTNCLFALKVMDIGLLASRSKLTRAQTEKEILQMLDHPFLPSLYGHFTTDKFSCLLMEYCPGGDLHVLRQKQLARAFSEQATRFYIAEVVLALEYLHMLGVVYRDLKPENVLVREDGHIMLTDFDLSLRCAVNLTMLKTDEQPKTMSSSSPSVHASCIGPFRLPTSLLISCFNSKFVSVAAKTSKIKSEAASQARTLPELIVEPTDARSNSFVGTHEYLAPEIIKGEGHGSAVDWWTLGILLYELLYGKTPFKAQGDEDTLINIASGSLKFPETTSVSSNARDLIRCLLQKEPQKRLGFEKGAAEIKQHPFFQGLNWALIRCTTPPYLPKSYDKGSSNTENERSLGDYTIEEDLVMEMF